MKTGHCNLICIDQDCSCNCSESEYMPAKIGNYLLHSSLFKQPVKFIMLPEPLISYSDPYVALVIRTDCYPLLWILVYWEMQIESLFKLLYCRAMLALKG